MNERTIPADRSEPSPFGQVPVQTYSGSAGEANRWKRVAHAPTVGNAWGMKRMGLPGPEGIDWLCTADAAKLLNMSTSGVRKLVAADKIYAAKFGRELALRDKDVRRYAAKPRTVGGLRQGFKKN